MFKKNQPTNQPNRRRQNRDEDRENTQPINSYRRNRTIVGSSSSKISSSNELNAEVMSPRAKIHHLSRHRRRLFTRFVLVIVSGLALYVLTSQLVATVKVSSTNDSVELPVKLRTAYQDRIQLYYGIHPVERFYPSLNHQGLLLYMQEKYPELQQLSTNLSGEIGTESVTVTLRKPVARWTIQGNNEYVDADGVVFDYNGYSTPQVQIIDKSGISASQAIVTSHRFLGFVGSVVGQLKARSYQVQSVAIPALTTRQLEVQLNGISYHFKLTVDRSSGEQAEDIARIIAYMKKNNITPSYVDVRVEGEAFYK